MPGGFKLLGLSCRDPTAAGASKSSPVNLAQQSMRFLLPREELLLRLLGCPAQSVLEYEITNSSGYQMLICIGLSCSLSQ